MKQPMIVNNIANMRTDLLIEKGIEANGCEFVAPSSYKGEEFTYTFSLDKLNLDLIDIEKSKEISQSRLTNKIDTEKVTDYACCMERGDVFPGMVLIKTKEGKYHIIGGFHTYEAIRKCGATHVCGVYMFEHPDSLEIGAQLNCGHGGKPPLSEILEIAVRAYTNKKDKCEANNLPLPTQKEYAFKFKVSEKKFNQHLLVTDTQEILSHSNLDVSRIKHKTSFQHIRTLMDIDKDAGVRLASMAIDFNISPKELVKAVDDYKDPSVPTQDKIAKLDAFENQFKRQSNNGKITSSKKSTSVESKFRLLLSSIYENQLKVDQDKLKTMLNANPESMKKLVAVCDFLKSLK